METTSIYKTNDEVSIAGLKVTDTGVGIVEAWVHGTEKIAVRFNTDLFSKQGTQYMQGKTVLNPNGRNSFIFCLSPSEIISVGKFNTRKSESSDVPAKRNKRKTRS